MPLYVYQVIREDGQPGERFEIMQGIRDAALTEHPETGEPVKTGHRRPVRRWQPLSNGHRTKAERPESARKYGLHAVRKAGQHLRQNRRQRPRPDQPGLATNSISSSLGPSSVISFKIPLV